jgi:DNA-binding NtrC family response regulator
VESQPGHGSRFTIHLPAASPGEQVAKPKAATITTPTRCRVLVAEYQPEIRSLVERILAREGFPIIAAASGDEALAALGVEGGSFGLLLVGGIMPGRPTGEVIQRALAMNAECRVIIVSDQMQDELLLRGIETGRYGQLAKPFDAGQLREAVNDALRQVA